MNPEKKPCCDRCIPAHGVNNVCLNPSCPCHSPLQEKLERGAKDFADRFEGVMKELAEEESPDIEGTQAEFLKIWGEGFYRDQISAQEVWNIVKKLLHSYGKQEYERGVQDQRFADEEIIKKKYIGIGQHAERNQILKIIENSYPQITNEAGDEYIKKSDLITHLKKEKDGE